MKNISSEWFECKVRYQKEVDGEYKKVSEIYTVDALTFTESEARITDEMSKYISGEYSVIDIKKAPYKEVLFNEDDNASYWYKCKVGFITIDEKTEKEKIQNFTYLVQAENLLQATKLINDEMYTTGGDYIITEVKETKVIDVIVHKSIED